MNERVLLVVGWASFAVGAGLLVWTPVLRHSAATTQQELLLDVAQRLGVWAVGFCCGLSFLQVRTFRVLRAIAAAFAVLALLIVLAATLLSV